MEFGLNSNTLFKYGGNTFTDAPANFNDMLVTN